MKKNYYFLTKEFTTMKSWFLKTHRILNLVLFCSIMVSFVRPANAYLNADRAISGKITGQHNEPLAGVNISLKGTSIGTTSDAVGNYKITIPEKQLKGTLLYSFVGYTSKEVVIGNQTSINVSLTEDITNLSEVVVVGYGTQKVKDLTGSVGVVKVDNAKKTATSDIAKMLQGQIAGVSVQSSGDPGAAATVKIRGISSFGDNNPLYVVDGVPIENPQDFAPGDIESIQVLKDATAGAIYGARGAGGVIIITTKKGQEGPLQVTYNGYAGVQNIAKRIDLMDRVGYQKVVSAAEINAGLGIAPANNPSSPSYISTVNTDWQKEALKTGYITDHNLNLSGGSKALRTNIGIGYFNQTSTITGPQAYNRLSLNANVVGEKGIFKFGAKVALTDATKIGAENTREHAVFGGAVASMLTAIPTMPVYDANRLGGFGGSDNNTQRAITLNVVGMNSLLKGTDRRNRMITNAWGEVEVLKNLKYKLNLSHDHLDFTYQYFEPEYDLGFYYLTPNAIYNENHGTYDTDLAENTLSYNVSVGKHKIDALAGYTFQKTVFNATYGTLKGLDKPYILQMSAPLKADGGKGISGTSDVATLASILGRVNYNFNDKYLLTFNFRRDGSSRFSPDNRYGTFMSLGAAWNIHNDIQLPVAISTLKLRGGFGELGNQNIGNYRFSTFINGNAGYVFNGTLQPGATRTQVVDPSIKWESKRTSNVAVDLGLFADKLSITAEYYNNTSYDVLANVPLPYSVGATNGDITTNAATVNNKGIEISATYRKKTGDFQYEISGNFYTLSNKVVKLGGNDNPIYGAASITQVGGEVGQLYGYKTEGIFQSKEEITNHALQPLASIGDVKFVDTNGDKVINNLDRVNLGSAIPSVYYGMNFSASYKNFDASFFLQGHGGNQIYNGVYRDLMGLQYSNGSVDALNFWSPSNTNTLTPRPVIGDPNQNNRDSDRFVENGTFLKMQNLQIGYNVPSEILGKIKSVSSVRVYLSGQNVFLLSGYKGFDPDFSSDGLFSRGYDYGSYPNPRTFMAGIQVGF
jgi:TonB-linked SusC/RagA family outer membrane protein